ncbi:MAG: hypothetical protein ACTHJX_10485 [Terriglobales bacterium]
MRRLIPIVAAVLLAAGPAAAAITQVQHCGASTSSCSLTGTGSGHFLVVAYDYFSASPTATCSDGVNSYTVAGTAVNATVNASLVVSYAANIAGGNITVTCTTESSPAITVVEYSGVATTSPIDGSVGSSNQLGASGESALTWPTLSVSDGDGVFAAGAAQGGGPMTSWTSPMAVIVNRTGQYDSQADDLAGTAGSVTPQGSATGVAQYWAGVDFAFKPAGSPPPVTMVPRHGSSVCCGGPRP